MCLTFCAKLVLLYHMLNILFCICISQFKFADITSKSCSFCINITRFKCLFVWGLPFNPWMFYSFGDYRWRAANFDLYSALMGIEQWGFLNVSNLLWHRAFAYYGLGNRETNTCCWAFISIAAISCVKETEWSRPLLDYIDLFKMKSSILTYSSKVVNLLS